MYPRSIDVLSKNKKNITIFHLKIFVFTAVKMAAIYIGMLSFQLPFVVSDRFGRKVVMVFSHIGLFAVVLGTSFCQSYTAFIVLRILTGAVQQVRI